MKSNNELLVDILRAAIRTVDPYRAVMPYADGIRSVYAEQGYERLHLLGFGRAAIRMTHAMADSLEDLLADGFIIMKCERMDVTFAPRIRVFQTGHPLPDLTSRQAVVWAMDFVKGLGPKDMLLCLVSGGDSAILDAPYRGISFAEREETARLLVKAGVDSDELKAVINHISATRGGRLAEMAYPAGVYSLIFSDVVSDRLDMIASGPTAPDNTTHGQALSVIEKYGLRDRIPGKVHDLLVSGTAGLIPETPKEGDAIFSRVTNTIVGSNRQALEAARMRASELGLETAVITQPIEGDAQEAGRLLAGEVLKMASASPHATTGKTLCIISGGEEAVTVKRRGAGGKNTEIALTFALEIEGNPDIAMLSAGTDGIDGPTDAAGVIVDGRTTARARAMGIRPEEYLENEDSYDFFKKFGGLLMSGPKGDNVMDIQLILIGPNARP